MAHKIGDIVELKSGGPKMTVSALGTIDGVLHVTCHWFEGATPHEGRFPVEAVRRASPDPTPTETGRSRPKIRRIR